MEPNLFEEYLNSSFVPYGKKEVNARYEQEVKDMRSAGPGGPVQLETTTLSDAQTSYFVVMIPSKSIGDTSPALMELVHRIANFHESKAVYQILAERAYGVLCATRAV